ncbi:hypothetical protein [Burkholderia plantarii]|uniref:hypothetical protein n=1 Tax=Burkholderia plantarii TaxID=41899 RepID=UPI0018DB94ED|nr:hypothetical protein [Burkholderia plantarii]
MTVRFMTGFRLKLNGPGDAPVLPCRQPISLRASALSGDKTPAMRKPAGARHPMTHGRFQNDAPRDGIRSLASRAGRSRVVRRCGGNRAGPVETA